MSKNIYQIKMKAGVLGLHILSLMLAVGILCFSVSQCVIITRDVEQIRSYDDAVLYYKGNGEQIRFVNPFESDVKYEETDAFSDTFQSDAASLISYLAVCRQFETDGVFDPDKEVDILSYYCRKDPSLNVDSDGAFVYKVQDLITWADSYGFTSEENNCLEEVFLPSDGVSVNEKEEQLFQFVTLINGKMQIRKPQSDLETDHQELDMEDSYEEDYDDDTSYEEEYYTEDFYTEEKNIDDSMNVTVKDTEEELDEAESEETIAEEETYDAKKESRISVDNGNGETYIKVTSIGDKQTEKEEILSMEEVRGLYYDILLKVASDLSYNYVEYQKQKNYFINYGNNFKYLYVPDGNQNYSTNLSVENLTDAQAKTKYFNEQLAAYVIIDVKNGNIEAKTANVLTGNVLSYLNSYKYAFSNGGKLYIGVLDDMVEGFADYASQDNYGQLKYLTTNNLMNMKLSVGWVLFLVMFSLVLLVINTILCGRNTEDEEIHLIAFDHWYTEIGWALGCGVAFLFVAVFFMAITVMEECSVRFIYRIFHDHYFMMIMVAYVAVVDACFLFFYNSLIRRIKARRLWSGSLLCNLLKGMLVIGKKIVMGTIILFGKANILGKTILTFLQVLFLIVIHYIAFESENVGLLFVGVLFDITFFLLLLYVNVSRDKILEGIEKISGGELEYQMETTHMYGDSLRWANAVNSIGNGIRDAVNQSMKDERMKADLITNVSHDIKTPLTSIINYVDLLKRENVQDETIQGYIEVLDNKSQRLKQLTEDLVEASKISSGNIVLSIEELNVVDLMKQALGEFDDKFESKGLTVMESYSESPCIICADSRRMWRVIDNLLGNIYKYALENTRVYVEVRDLKEQDKKVSISIKNISQQALNIEADELTERFIRGDISRSTEGSGLGLSIAKNLVEAQGGNFQLYLDGDLFKVTITF